MTVVSGLSEETFNFSTFVYSSNTIGATGSYNQQSGIGINATTLSGFAGLNGAGAGSSTLNVYAIGNGQYLLSPFIGANQINFLEQSGSGGTHAGGELNNLMLGTWRG